MSREQYEAEAKRLEDDLVAKLKAAQEAIDAAVAAANERDKLSVRASGGKSGEYYCVESDLGHLSALLFSLADRVEYKRI